MNMEGADRPHGNTGRSKNLYAPDDCITKTGKYILNSLNHLP
jgi:hypothetical protein